MRFAAILLMVVPAFAVDGTVVNQTTGQPAANTVISLYKLGQGMEILATVKTDAQGKFQISKDVEGPRLVQTVFDGVVYNQMLSPGAPTTGINIAVYNASKKPLDVSEHFLFLQPSGDRLTVNEVFVYRNNGKTTWQDSGTLRFWVPQNAQETIVRATAPGGMPVERPAEKTAEKGVFKVEFPVKPGETRFELAYNLPYQQGMAFSGRAVYAGDAQTFLLAPQGVTLEGEGLENKGAEPSTQAIVWATAARNYTAKISGEMAAAAGTGGDSSGPQIEQIAPRIGERAGVIVGLTLGLLALGFILLYRRQEGHGERGRG